jgi:hypothetical protein
MPQDWCAIHDRFITYLATHAPLTENGKIPAREELRERWKTSDIARMVRERFPCLSMEVSALLDDTEETGRGLRERGMLMCLVK